MRVFACHEHAHLPPKVPHNVANTHQSPLKCPYVHVAMPQIHRCTNVRMFIHMHLCRQPCVGHVMWYAARPLCKPARGNGGMLGGLRKISACSSSRKCAERGGQTIMLIVSLRTASVRGPHSHVSCIGRLPPAQNRWSSRLTHPVAKISRLSERPWDPLLVDHDFSSRAYSCHIT